MIAADHGLRDLAVAHADATLRVVDLLKSTRSIQYELPPGARVVTPDVVSDPTGETAVSGTRLALRAGVEDALVRMELATADFTKAADALEHLLERHMNPRQATAA